MNEQSIPGPQDAAAIPPRRRWVVFLVPGIAFLVFAMFAWGLIKGSNNLPSTLIGKPVPEFSLPPVQGRLAGLSSADLGNGEVSLVNVFASWCIACRAEHPLLMELSRSGAVTINGINYKDKPDEAEAWLAELGDPYTRTGADLDGRASIEWGVYGIPETFVVDKDGIIAYKNIGQITPRIVEEEIMPLVRELQARPMKVVAQ